MSLLKSMRYCLSGSRSSRTSTRSRRYCRCTSCTSRRSCPLQALDLRMRLAELVLEPQHELDAGEVEPELGGEPLNDPQPLDVGFGVEPRAAGRPLRPDEALRLVHPQRLRVHADELGGYRDHVDRTVRGLHQPTPFWSSSRSSRSFLFTRFGTCDPDACEHVALAGALEARRAAALDPQQLAVLGARGNLERHGALRRRHLDLAAERGGREGDRHLHDQVVAAALVE